MEFRLRSKNYEESRVVVVGAAVVQGEFDTYGVNHGFYGFNDGAIGDTMSLIYKAEKVLAAKTAALAIASGDKVYFNTTTRLITKTNTDELCGTCIEVAAAADSFVLIDFNGTEEFLKA